MVRWSLEYVSLAIWKIPLLIRLCLFIRDFKSAKRGTIILVSLSYIRKHAILFPRHPGPSSCVHILGLSEAARRMCTEHCDHSSTTWSLRNKSDALLSTLQVITVVSCDICSLLVPRYYHDVETSGNSVSLQVQWLVRSRCSSPFLFNDLHTAQ